MIKTDATGTNCPAASTSVSSGIISEAVVKIRSVGLSNNVASGDPFDVIVNFDVAADESLMQMIAILYSSQGLYLGASEFEDIVTSSGSMSLSVAFHGAVEPQTGCELKVNLYQKAVGQTNGVGAVQSQSVWNDIAIVSGAETEHGAGLSDDWEGCSIAASWNFCLNVEPFKSRCEWGGNPKHCYSTSAIGLDMSRSSSFCEDRFAEQSNSNQWNNEHPTVCGGSRGTDNKCFGSQALHKASQKCRAHGARLCTASELEMGVASRSGCGYNFRYAWSSTSCAGGFIIRTGNVHKDYPPLCVASDVASANAFDVYTRCCEDVETVPAPVTTSTSATVTFTTVTTVTTVTATTTLAIAPECTDAETLANCNLYKELGFCTTSNWESFLRRSCQSTCWFCPNQEQSLSNVVIVLPDVDETCSIGVRKICNNPQKGCCMAETTCAPIGALDKLKCRALPLRGKAQNPIGTPCEKHKTCGSGWCDKKARFAPKRWMCWEKDVKSKDRIGKLEGTDPSDEDEVEESESSKRLVLVSTSIIILLALGVVFAICIVASHSQSCKDSHMFDQGDRSSATGESLHYDHFRGMASEQAETIKSGSTNHEERGNDQTTINTNVV
jgi:hypothetical protein